MIGQGDWSWGDRASGSPWGQHSQALNGGKMAPTPNHTILSLPESLTLAPREGTHHRFRRGCSQPAPLQKQAQLLLELNLVEPLGLNRTGQMSLLLGEWYQLSLQGLQVRMAPCTIAAQPSAHLESWTGASWGVCSEGPSSEQHSDLPMGLSSVGQGHWESEGQVKRIIRWWGL